MDKSRLVISYTVGPHEYPNYKPESFDPDKELVRKVGQQIHDEVSGKLGISHTRMEAWRDTTFAITPIKDKRNEPVPKEVKREIASNVKEPKITLFLSPELRQSGSSSTESERKSGDPFERVSDEVSSSIKETLGLPYVESEVVWAEFADSQVSIEFDCRVESGYRIPQEAREAAAESVEKALNQNVYTRDREAEIWIRQGSPEVETFNSE